MTDYLAQSHRKPVVDWLLSKGFIVEDEIFLALCWSNRSGMDSTCLLFYPLDRHAGDEGWDAVVRHHSGGENPKLDIGRCETLADVQMVYDTLRRINGYKKPEPERGPEFPSAITT